MKTHKNTIFTVCYLFSYAQCLRKTLKIYKKANRFMWILTILLIMAWGTYVLVLNWPSKIEAAFEVFFMCFFIALILLVAFFISHVYNLPNVELMLEVVLEDLKKYDAENQNKIVEKM